MKKNIGINGFFYFLYVFGSCFIVMLIESLFVNVVEKFVALPYPVLTVIRIVIYTVGVVAVLVALSLGLKRPGDVTVQPDNAATKGKIAVISHMVEVH